MKHPLLYGYYEHHAQETVLEVHTRRGQAGAPELAGELRFPREMWPYFQARLAPAFQVLVWKKAAGALPAPRRLDMNQPRRHRVKREQRQPPEPLR